jgi:hypothetical protein
MMRTLLMMRTIAMTRSRSSSRPASSAALLRPTPSHTVCGRERNSDRCRCNSGVGGAVLVLVLLRVARAALAFSCRWPLLRLAVQPRPQRRLHRTPLSHAWGPACSLRMATLLGGRDHWAWAAEARW